MVIEMLIKDLHNFPIITISHQPEEQVSVDETIQVYETLLAKQEVFCLYNQWFNFTRKERS